MQREIANNIRVLLVVFLCHVGNTILLAQNGIEDPTGKEVALRHGYVRQGKKAMGNRDLPTADSLFSKALELWGDEEVFLLRAETRGQLGLRAGFCSDLKSAHSGGYDAKFEKECLRKDSVAFNMSALSAERFPGAENVARRLDLAEGRTYFRLYDDRDSLDAEFYINKEDTLFLYCEKTPLFGGGTTLLNDYLRDHVIYPPEAEQAGIHGNVYVQFIVDKEGIVKNAQVKYSAHPVLAKEALRVVTGMEDWQPARFKGRDVPFVLNLPISFKLK